MPYRPVYVAAWVAHDDEMQMIWDSNREPVYQKFLDWQYLVQEGDLKAASFVLLDVPVSPIRTRAYLLAHPSQWRP